MMNAYRIETTLSEEGALSLKEIPFHVGESVEVIILSSEKPKFSQKKTYPLRGTALEYHFPTEPVSEEDWEIQK